MYVLPLLRLKSPIYRERGGSSKSYRATELQSYRATELQSYRATATDTDKDTAKDTDKDTATDTDTHREREEGRKRQIVQQCSIPAY
jgi:hypothetical protein